MESKVVYDIFHLVYWDWRIVLDLFLGGIGVGAFLCALGVMYYKKSDQLVSVKIGSIIGPLAMSAGLLCMLLEMGQPLRIYKTLLRFNLTSTLSWGGFLQEAFIFFSALFAFLLLINKNKELRQKLAGFAGFFALFVAFYHGSLLSFVTARPLWNSGTVSMALVVSSINTGIAALLLLTSFSAKGRGEIRELNAVTKNIILIALLTQISISLIWLVTLLTGGADFVNAYHILNQSFGLLFWIGAILVGLLVPFVILVSCSVGSKKDQAIPVLLVSLPILIGGFVFRYVLILAGQIS